ncbi:MAG TPA: SPW repeat protein [Nitrobacter sp.]|jgi:hypothetical protein|nr:SPW repeat protein [Nitrobacter sp.]
MLKWRSEAVLDIYNLVLALVLFAAPWFLSLTKTATEMDLWISGAAIAVISLGAIAAFTRWDEWANLFLGLWLIASPWLLGFTHTRAMHVSIGIGIVVAFMAGLELMLTSSIGDDEKTAAPPSTQGQDHPLFH